MGRLQNSIELFKASWAMLRQDKELFVLPVLSGIASLATIGLFAVPILATLDGGSTLAGEASGGAGPVTYVLTALLYVTLAFITVFFNSALVHGANERMSGGDPTVASALSGAASRLNRILSWAIVSATVSFVIRQIQERAGFLGAVLGFLGGLAWAAVTFLVLPILVIENVGVVDALKRSAGLLRTAWGEGLAGHLGLGLIGFLASLPFIAIGAVGILTGDVALVIITFVIAALGLVAVAVVMSALSVVYQTALYRYAIGQPVAAYRTELMQSAFRPKRR